MKEVFLMIGKRIVLMLLCLCLLCTSLPLVAAAESPYYIRVDLTNNIVTVYSTLDDSVVRQMICSGGMARYKSPRGTYTMPTQRKKFERSDWYTFEDGYGKFGSRIVGSYLFHSYLFHSKNDEDVDWETYAAMGTDASHGCIRLYIEDAKWIADNCLAGTKVTLYDNDTRYDYLKELLYQQTYTIDSGKTYAEFVCMASNDTELGYYSKGEPVTDLQNRMIALGLYAGEADGFYDETMVRAIKAIQTVLGRRPTGVADNELVEILMSDDAPTSTISTLEPGMSGPAVRSLQQTLAALGIYEGTPSGTYDQATADAVKTFQTLMDEPADGIADAALQSEMLSGFARLEAEFGADGFALTYEDQVVETAVIDSQKRINLRAKKSTESTILTHLDPGTEVAIEEKGDSWTKITVCSNTGYVKNKYLKITQNTVRVPKYVAADASHPALPETVYGDKVMRTQVVAYGKVNTEDRLYIRESPSNDATAVFMLSSGATVKINSVNDGWAYVTYGGKSGFTRLKYLDAWKTVELMGSYLTASTDLAAPAEADEAVYALVTDESGAVLRGVASASGEALSEIPTGEQLEVVFQSTSWTQVCWGDQVGYVSNDQVQIGTQAELDQYLAAYQKAAEVFAIVNTGADAGLNLRQAADAQAEVLRVLDNGSIVTLLSDDGTWSQVSINGLTGYVMSQYLRPVTDSGNTFDPVEAGYEPVDEADYSGWDDPTGQTDETGEAVPADDADGPLENTD